MSKTKTESSNFKLIKSGASKYLHEKVRYYTHLKAGGEVYFIESSDVNKTFEITFKTPSCDSTGVTHIIEHSVLSGSKKYKTGDPFKDYGNKSLATFYNAFTGQDATSYIFSSNNETDFMNFLDIYLDAVFNPEALQDERIFKAEGWYYDVDDKENLVINGIVYNEMKKSQVDRGAVIYNATKKALYPGFKVANVSGGSTNCIPKLTYEKFKTYYSTYYKPSNSITVFYGNVNIEECLKKLDEYFGGYTKGRKAVYYPNNPESPCIKNASFTYPASRTEKDNDDNVVRMVIPLPGYLNEEDMMLFETFNTYLTTSGIFNLKETVVLKGLANNVSANIFSTALGSFNLIEASGVKKCNLDKVKEVINDTFKEITEKGFDCNTLFNIIENNYINDNRNDFSNYNKFVISALRRGRINGVDIFECDYNFYYQCLKEAAKNNQSDDFIKEFTELYILLPKCWYYFSPDENYAVKELELEKDRIKKVRNKLTCDDLEKIKAEAKSIKTFRLEKRKGDETDNLPSLNISDLPKKALWIEPEVVTSGGIKTSYYEVDVKNITSLEFHFDLEGFLFDEELKYIPLFKDFVLSVDTKKHKTSKVQDLLRENVLSAYVDYKITRQGNNEFVLTVQCLNEKVKQVMAIFTEIFAESEFNDLENVVSKIKGNASGLSKYFSREPHLYVSKALLGGYDKAGFIRYELSNVEYVNFLKELAEKIEKNKIDISAKLRRISKKLYSCSRLDIVVVSGDTESTKEKLVTKLITLSKAINRKKQDKNTSYFMQDNNKCIVINSLVNYIGMRYDFPVLDSYTPVMLDVIERIIQDEYLWDNIRVKGGAYGGFSEVSIAGFLKLISYRDPNYEKTLEVFEDLPNFLMNYNGNVADAVIRTYGSYEGVKTVYSTQDKCEKLRRMGVTEEVYNEYLDKAKEMTVEDVRNFGRELISANKIYAIASSREKLAEDFRKTLRFKTVIEI